MENLSTKLNAIFVTAFVLATTLYALINFFSHKITRKYFNQRIDELREEMKIISQIAIAANEVDTKITILEAKEIREKIAALETNVVELKALETNIEELKNELRFEVDLIYKWFDKIRGDQRKTKEVK